MSDTENPAMSHEDEKEEEAVVVECAAERTPMDSDRLMYKRFMELTTALAEKGMRQHPKSKVCQAYIDGTLDCSWSIERIVQLACEMRYLFEFTDYKANCNNACNMKLFEYMAANPGADPAIAWAVIRPMGETQARALTLETIGGFPETWPWTVDEEFLQASRDTMTRFEDLCAALSSVQHNFRSDSYLSNSFINGQLDAEKWNASDVAARMKAADTLRKDTPYRDNLSKLMNQFIGSNGRAPSRGEVKQLQTEAREAAIRGETLDENQEGRGRGMARGRGGNRGGSRGRGGFGRGRGSGRGRGGPPSASVDDFVRAAAQSDSGSTKNPNKKKKASRRFKRFADMELPSGSKPDDLADDGLEAQTHERTAEAPERHADLLE